MYISGIIRSHNMRLYHQRVYVFIRVFKKSKTASGFSLTTLPVCQEKSLVVPTIVKKWEILSCFASVLRNEKNLT